MKRTNSDRLKNKHQAERDKLRGERNRTELLVHVLCEGLAKSLTDCGPFGQDQESIGYIKELFDTMLLPAVIAADAANAAYRPYWGRRYKRATRAAK